jgi:hypothetical protein
MDEHEPLIERLRGLGQHPVDPATAGRHLGAMAGVRHPRARAVKLKVGGAFFAGLLIGGTGLATAGALPGPAQDAAHSALSTVGVNVPDGHQRYNNPADCGASANYRNHGQYVKANKAKNPKADQSRCGKPLVAGTGDGTNETEGPEPAEAPEPPEAPEAPDSQDNGKSGAAHANKGKHDNGDQADNNQGDNNQGDDNETPGTPTPGAAPLAPTPTSTTSTTRPPTTTTSSTTTSSTTTSTTSTTKAA